MNNSFLNVIIITTAPFPVGLAITSRIRLIARALHEKGHNVSILRPYPCQIQKNVDGNSCSGKYYCMEYKTMLNRKYWANNKILRCIEKAYNIPLALFSLGLEIRRKRKIGHSTICIITASDNLTIIWSRLCTLILKIPFYYERSEFPFWGQVRPRIYFFIDWLGLQLMYKLFDGMIVITDTLERYYKKFCRKSCRFFKLPILVDLGDFPLMQNGETPEEFNYITYCGNMSGNKDGIMDLLQAFASIAPGFPNHRLRLIGGASQVRMKEIREFIIMNNLEKQVELTGFLANTEIPALLLTSYVLVLARPDNRQAKGGFPTKLGEYLATGQPVIVTAVGEIPNYIRDGVNGILVEPGNPEAFAAKIKEILSNPVLAHRVGKEGRKLAEIEFDYRCQASRMEAFLSDSFRAKSNHDT